MPLLFIEETVGGLTKPHYSRIVERFSKYRLIIPHPQDLNRLSSSKKIGWVTKIAATALVTLQIIVPVFLVVAPIPTEASIFSFISGIFGVQASASDDATDAVNSQKMPLLEAPVVPVNNAGVSSTLTVEGGALLAQSLTASSKDTSSSNNQPTSNKISTYKVQTGDTVTGIAQKFNISVNTILWANHLKRTSTLSIGQTLIILPISGVQHKVQAGDTLLSIAKQYKGDVAEIRDYNNLDSDKLKIGDVIVIPDGEVLAPTIVQPVTPKKTSVIAKVAQAAVGVGVVAADTAPIDGYYIRPIKAGVRTQGLHGNNGVDLADSCGTPIYASAAGDVLISKDDDSWDGGYGNYVVISHDNGSQTLYAHMQQTLVTEGKHVTQGQMIGLIGATGKVKGTTGCHVHFEIRNGPANPF